MSQTAEWCPLGNNCYRKFKIYDMKWQNVHFSNALVAAEKYGGHIAIACNIDENGAKRTQFVILFFTSTGQLLNKVQWKNGDLICMNWSPDTEELICVQNDGRVFIYSLFGLEKEDRRFSMGKEAQEMKLSDCKLFDSYNGTGLCVLTKLNRFYVVNNVEDPKVWRTAELHGKSAQPSCWTVLSKDRVTKVICALGNEIYFLEQGKLSDPIVPAFDSPVKHYVSIALSPNKEKFVFLSENGLIQISSSDLQVPDVLCGNEAVALHNDGILELISLDGDSVHFPIEENVHLLEEIDGIRIFDSIFQEFLEKVPAVCAQTFSVGSIAPSATLLEASKEYRNKSYKAYDFVRMIGNVEDAVKVCVDAALAEYNLDNQKLLLQAASLGKAFVTNSDGELLANSGRTLRVLNAVRDKLIGIPLTYVQLQTLSMPVLIDRLILRSQWPLALACCQHLKYSTENGVSKILAHWAYKKMTNKLQADAVLAEQIVHKFKHYQDVSFADAAQKAAELGRKELATLLLENESNLERQVTMLMKLGRNEKALAKACDSGDPDLISFVILHLRLTLENKGELDLILRRFPAAFSMFKNFCRDENPQHLKSLLKQTDDFVNHGLLLLKEANNVTVFEAREKTDLLKEAEKCFRQCKDEHSAHHIDDECKLLKDQSEYEQKFGQVFLDLPLRDTVIRLIELGENNRAQLLKKEFQVTDKQFWWWKIEALAKSSQWVELENFSKSKKSPVGYLPFIETAMKYNQVEEAKKYLPKVEKEEKIKAFIKMGLFEEAANFAFQNRDENSLNRILSHCGPQNRQISEKINQMKLDLNSTAKQK